MTTNPATGLHLLTRRLLLVVAIAGMLASTALPALARPPARSSLTVVYVSCTVVGDFGTGRLTVIHETPPTIGFGANVELWDPGRVPDEDAPDVSGVDFDVRRDDDTLTGQVPLRAGGEGPGQGIADDDEVDPIVGWASYEVTFATAGPVQETWVYKGPTYDQLERENHRFRTVVERTPLTATAVLTLPGAEPLRLEDCDGHQVLDQVFETQPATTVSRGEYPIEFDCVAQRPGETMYVTAAAFEASLALVPDGAENAVAFGGWFIDQTRTTVDGQIPMVDPGYEDLGDAHLRAAIRVLDREVRHEREGDARRTWHVQRLRIDGHVVFDGARYALIDCTGVRFDGHTIRRIESTHQTRPHDGR